MARKERRDEWLDEKERKIRAEGEQRGSSVSATNSVELSDSLPER